MKKQILHFLLVLLLFCSFQKLFSQYPVIYSSLTPCNYFAAQSEPDADWYKTDYDDSSWSSDTGSIGYGSDDYDIQVDDQTQSLYLRYEFNVDDPAAFDVISFWADYDDGYIAYLNGKEILRVNVDKDNPYPSFDDLSNRSHEPEYQNSLPVLAWYIDTTILDTTLISGTNCLAIQVLNDSIHGSDLFFMPQVYNLSTSNSYSIYTPFLRYKRQMDLDSTKLPIVKIETDEFGIQVKRIETLAHMGIIAGPEGTYNKPSDSSNVYYGSIEIEVRGESSASFPKQSYDFDLRDEFNEDTNVALLGMPAESDWILFGPWADKSQIRNPLIYYLTNLTGHWAPRTQFCEVILNGQFVGLYSLMEKIKRDDNRVDIARLNPDEISGIDLTGGYIIKHDKPDSRTIQIEYPKESDIQPQQINYINGFYNEYKSVLKSNSGLDPEIGYKKYIDESSLIDYIVISEFAKNCDAYAMSSYMYKDRDDNDPRIKYGPIWDFDLAFGNSPWQDGFRYDVWQFDFSTNRWFDIQRLFEDPALVDKFEDRWYELRETILSNDYVVTMIDSMVSELAEPVARNYKVWPVIDKYVFQENWPFLFSTYEEEIDFMKSWLAQRVEWVDDNISGLYYPVTIYQSATETNLVEGNIASIETYPNPFNRELGMDVYVPGNGKLKILLLNINGQVVDICFDAYMREGNYKLSWFDNTNVPVGIYFLDMLLDDKSVGRTKVVKLK